MIIFLGDSFTWGQGLEWEHMITNEGASVDYCNKLIPPDFACERLPLHLQDYREKNRWSRLVSEHFNQQYDLARCGNGGSNYDGFNFLENIEHYIHLENLDLIVFQFTNSHRFIFDDFEGTIEELFIKDVLYFENCMRIIKSKYGTEFRSKVPNIKFLTLSWLPEIATIIENRLGSEMVVKFNFDGEIYNSFEPFIHKITLHNKYEGLKDYHFTLEGHKLISKSVIEHIEKYNILNNKTKLI
jgi:hypothetical protein